MNKKLNYMLILLFTVVSLSANVYSKTINNNTYKNKSNAILVSTHEDNSNNYITGEEKQRKKFFNFDFSFNKDKNIPEYLIPVGNVVGIKINTDGILVLGTGYINTPDGSLKIPAKNKVFAGDIIFKVNGENIQTKEQLAEITSDAENVELVINRNNEIKTVNIKAEKSVVDDKYKIGIWVRDTTQGIGTVSYINPENNTYYALGHGIMDIDTQELMKVKDGQVLSCEITSINKGEKGLPGEIIGEIQVGESIGSVTRNRDEGVSGQIIDYNKLDIKYGKVEVASKEKVEIGKAYILSNIADGTVKRYDVKILQIDTKSKGNKNMVIEVVDDELLDTTSGIIQGMSGSPIIQNDKVIGAVTHVFVNNPTKGYAVFVENMVN